MCRVFEQLVQDVDPTPYTLDPLHPAQVVQTPCTTRPTTQVPENMFLHPPPSTLHPHPACYTTQVLQNMFKFVPSPHRNVSAAEALDNKLQVQGLGFRV